MANVIDQIQTSSGTYDVSDSTFGHSCNRSGLLHYTNTTDGTTTSVNGSVAVYAPLKAGTSNYYLPAGIFTTWATSNSNYFTKIETAGTSGTSSNGKTFYGIQVTNAGKYWLSVSMTGKNTTGRSVLGLIAQNGSTYTPLVVDTSMMFCASPTTVNYVLSNDSFVNLAANDIIRLAIRDNDIANTSTGTTNLTLSWSKQNLSVTYLG